MTALKESVFNHHIFCLSSYSFLWIPKVSYTVLEFTVFSFLCVWPDFCYKYLLSTYILNPILTKTLSSEYIVFLLRQINSSKNNTKKLVPELGIKPQVYVAQERYSYLLCY